MSTENFNAVPFEGAYAPNYGPGGPSSNTYSEAWNPTYYAAINNADGWSFGNGAIYATDGVSNGAVLLNESGSAGPSSNTSPLATISLTGLVPGSLYSVSFNYWGDNQQGLPYELTSFINGAILSTINGVDGAPGSDPGGHAASFTFTAAAPSAVLGFGQVTLSAASPIIDNVSVTAVPEPATAGLLMLAAGALGRNRLRRKR